MKYKEIEDELKRVLEVNQQLINMVIEASNKLAGHNLDAKHQKQIGHVLHAKVEELQYRNDSLLLNYVKDVMDRELEEKRNELALRLQVANEAYTHYQKALNVQYTRPERVAGETDTDFYLRVCQMKHNESISDFLRWLNEESEYFVAYHVDGDPDIYQRVGEHGMEAVLAEYYGIDLEQVEQYRQNVLKSLREVHDAATQATSEPESQPTA